MLKLRFCLHEKVRELRLNNNRVKTVRDIGVLAFIEACINSLFTRLPLKDHVVEQNLFYMPLEIKDLHVIRALQRIGYERTTAFLTEPPANLFADANNKLKLDYLEVAFRTLLGTAAATKDGHINYAKDVMKYVVDDLIDMQERGKSADKYCLYTVFDRLAEGRGLKVNYHNLNIAMNGKVPFSNTVTERCTY